MSREVEYVIDGFTVRGYVWTSFRTIPPTEAGMTEEKAREIVDEMKRAHLKEKQT